MNNSGLRRSSEVEICNYAPEKVKKEMWDSFAKTDVFEWYCINLKGKSEYKTFLEVIMVFCAA